MRDNVQRYRIGYTAAVLLIGLFFLSSLMTNLQGQAIPEQVPDLSLPGPDGKPVALRSFQGKTVLINFWATWCPPCIKEIPLFAELYRKHHPKGLEILGISQWDDAQKALDWAAKKGVPYPILAGSDEAVEAFGGFQSLPISFLVNPSGKIVKRYYAIDESQLADFEKEILQLMESGSLEKKSQPVNNISLLTAFLAGILSFLSPCVLPLIPSYISFLTGISYEEFTESDRFTQRMRWMTLLHAFLFVLGFSIIFLLLGASATYIGGLFTTYRGWLEKIVGIVIILFGLQISGILNLKFLLQEKKFHMENKPIGYLGSVLVGFSFGIGWTPCIGPILGSILGFAATLGNLWAGILLLAFYSLGMGIPFLLSALAVQSFFHYFKKIRRYIATITFLSGLFLVLIGILILTGYFVKLAMWMQGWFNAVFPWVGSLG